MERSSRKTLVGKVTSIKMDKTTIVSVDTYKKHPLYGKRFKRTKKFASHDEKNICKINDLVQIIETRPYSKTKKFRIEKIIEKSKDGK